MKFKKIAVKVGTNVLTRADGTLDITRLSAIVDQIAVLYRAGVRVVLISSGAVASGRSELRGCAMPRLDEVGRRQLYSAVGQAKLIYRYYELFREHGIACGQVLTTKENFDGRRHYLNQKHCMEAMLAGGVVPIVNENDTVSVTELMFTDNDELSGLIAAMMDMDALVILSNIDGIYDGNPSDAASRVIERVEPDADLSAYIATTRSSGGRGGMVTKHRIARKVAAEGITVIIANGKRDNVLASVLADNGPQVPCTVFVPSQAPASGVKKWIAHSDTFAKGRIVVNEGASRALVSGQGASLLPVGIDSVEGQFEKDDIVTVVSTDGTVLGWGRVSADSASIAALAGTHGAPPAVHADWLYLKA